MKENIYLSKRENSSGGINLPLILGLIIVILFILFGVVSLYNNSKTNPTDNSIISTTPIEVVTVTKEIIPTEFFSPSPTPTIFLTSTPSVTPFGTAVKLYFYKSPIKPNQDTSEIYSVNRYTTETNLVPFAIKEFFIGPNADEKTAGYILPFTLSGDSSCGGSSHKYSYNVPTLKLTICKQIDPTPESGDGGGYAGSSLKAMSRVLTVINSSLKIGNITKVEVYDKTGACYAPDTGLNGCAP